VIEKVRWPRKGAGPALAMNDLFRKNKQKAFTSPPEVDYFGIVLEINQSAGKDLPFKILDTF
jgi:hypothetical protein